MKYFPFIKTGFSIYTFQLIVSIILCSIAVIYIALASIPYNPFSLSYSHKSSIFILAPQGWGFFTRDAREEETYLYKKVKNKWMPFDKSFSSSSYFFGASRMGRKVIFEESSVSEKLDDSLYWVNAEYAGIDTDGFEKAKLLTIKNESVQPLIIGEFIMVRKRNVPWAWSSQYKSIVMPYKYVHFSSLK